MTDPPGPLGTGGDFSEGAEKKRGVLNVASINYPDVMGWTSTAAVRRLSGAS